MSAPIPHTITVFVVFPSLSKQIPGYCIKLGHVAFQIRSNSFITLSFDATVYSLATDSIIK
jgi:hypothetical protein